MELFVILTRRIIYTHFKVKCENSWWRRSKRLRPWKNMSFGSVFRFFGLRYRKWFPSVQPFSRQKNASCISKRRRLRTHHVHIHFFIFARGICPQKSGTKITETPCIKMGLIAFHLDEGMLYIWKQTATPGLENSFKFFFFKC